VIDQRLNESRLVEVQELVALGRRFGGGLLRLRAGRRNGGCGGRCGRTARDRLFQEITPAEALIRHVFLPASGSTSWCQMSFLAAKMRLFGLGRQGRSMPDCSGPQRWSSPMDPPLHTDARSPFLRAMIRKPSCLIS
jgi:hypothetical protein